MREVGMILGGCLLLILMVAVKLVIGVLLVDGVLAVMGGYEPTLFEKVLWVIGLVMFMPVRNVSSDSK